MRFHRFHPPSDADFMKRPHGNACIAAGQTLDLRSSDRARGAGVGLADAYHTIRLLAIIADDAEISERAPQRVVEALQNHGHLLTDDEIDSVRGWLTGLHAASRLQSGAPCRAER